MSIASWFRTRRIKRKIRAAKACLRWIDRQMAKLGCPAWKRQQMRRDIVTSDKAWLDCLDLLIDAKAKPLTRQQMAGSKRVIKAALETVEHRDPGSIVAPLLTDKKGWNQAIGGMK